MTAVEVAIEGFTKRRILIYFVRQALRAQSTLSVRGSSRRIMCMRFRPANTRVIKRRVDRLVRHLCRPPSNQDEQQNPSRKKVLTRLPILENLQACALSHLYPRPLVDVGVSRI